MRILTSLILLGASACVCAAPVTRSHRYGIGDAEFESVLVYDDSVTAPRPGVLMVPNWLGINEDAIERAQAVAGKDYVVLLADVYGVKVRPANAEEAGKAAGAAYADREALRARNQKALDVLIEQAGDLLAKDKLAAIGFCFGGANVLELARSGADLDGVVSFHGNLSTTMPAQQGAMKASVLVLNGADDSYVPAAQIDGFSQEMRAAGADWQFVNFSGAVHCFAEPSANSPPGCVYNQRAADRAYTMMRGFFAEIFARP